MNDQIIGYVRRQWPFWVTVGCIVVLFITLMSILLAPPPVCHKSHEALFTAPRGDSGAFDKEGKPIPLPPFQLVIKICEDHG